MAPFIIKVAMCPHAHRDYPDLRSSVLVDLNRAYRSGCLDHVRHHVFADWNRQFPAVPLDEGSIQFHRRSAPCNRTLGFDEIKANHGFADDGQEVNPAKVLMMHVTGKEGRRPYRLPARGQQVQGGQSRKTGRNGQRQGATRRQQRYEQDDDEDEDEDEEEVPKRREAGQSRGRGGGGAPHTQDGDDEEDDDEGNENDADERYSASTDDTDTGNFDASPALEEDDKYREDGDERKFVRVGRIPEQDDEADENDPNDNRITMRVIVVAVVERIASRPPRRGRDAVPPYDQVTYKGVETWRINSRRVGDYPSADNYNSYKDIPGFVMDSFWGRLWRDKGLSLDEKVGRYLKSNSTPRVVPDYLDFKGEVRQGSPLMRSRPIKAPCKPKHFRGPANTFFTTYSGIHEKTDEKGGRGEINAVITFRNTSDQVGDLRLATNVQATLEWKESLESFRKYIKTELFPETEDSCLWQRLRNKRFTHWTDLEICVLPQWRRDKGAKRPKELVQWDKKGAPRWYACDFLDQKGIRTYGRQLYFEVRIVCDKRANEKDEIWKRSGYEKGRTRKYGFIHKGVKDDSLLDDIDDDRQGHVARNAARTQAASGTGTARPSATQGAPARSGPASSAGRKRPAQSTAGPSKKKQKTSKRQ